MDLNGARILVVGATGVLGRRLCERLSERTTDIVVTGRSASAAEELRRGLGLKCPDVGHPSLSSRAGTGPPPGRGACVRDQSLVAT